MLVGLGIPNVGKKTGKQIASVIAKYDQVQEQKKDSLLSPGLLPSSQ